jgi:hypothetical protein
MKARRDFLLGSCFSRDCTRSSSARFRFCSILAFWAGVSLDGDAAAGLAAAPLALISAVVGVTFLMYGFMRGVSGFLSTRSVVA